MLTVLASVVSFNPCIILFVLHINFHFLLQQATQNYARACQKVLERSQPWIAAGIGDSPTQYLIVCEQDEVTKVSTVQIVLFVVFSLYYCSHLQYPDKGKWIYHFFRILF